MKKVLSILLSFLLIFSMAIPAVASENQTVVSLELDPTMESYTLTIPATVELDPAEKVGYLNITLENINLVWSKTVNVTMTAANGSADGGSYLVNEADETQKIHYIIKNFLGDEYDYDNNFGVVYTDLDGDVNGGGLSFEIDGSYPGAGTYTDTLTFNVKLS